MTRGSTSPPILPILPQLSSPLGGICSRLTDLLSSRHQHITDCLRAPPHHSHTKPDRQCECQSTTSGRKLSFMTWHPFLLHSLKPFSLVLQCLCSYLSSSSTPPICLTQSLNPPLCCLSAPFIQILNKILYNLQAYVCVCSWVQNRNITSLLILRSKSFSLYFFGSHAVSQLKYFLFKSSKSMCEGIRNPLRLEHQLN